ncbi:MAG: hypothetical protein ACYTGB_16505 [Planctomycetota bacterium]
MIGLFKAFIYLNIGLWPITPMVVLALTKEGFLDPAAEGDAAYFRMGFMVAGVLLALWMLVLVLRIVSRWMISGAGIFVRDGEVSFKIPRPSAWYSPLLTVEEKTFPLSAVKGTGFTAATDSRLTVQAESEEIEIPPGTFAEGPCAIEAGLREAVGGELRPEKPGGEWSMSSAARRTAWIIIAVILGGPIAGVAVMEVFKIKNDVAMGVFAGVFGLGFLLSFFLLFLLIGSGGRLLFDSRGVFYERRGKVSFAPWDMLDPTCIDSPTQPMIGLIWLLWNTLEIKTKSGLLKRAACRISLNRFMGLGFPLGEIEEVLSKRAAKRI